MHEPYVQEIYVQKGGVLGNEPWHLTGLTNLVMIFGKNGSGKSRLLRSWRDTDAAGVHYVVPERTGELDYQPQFLQQQLVPNSRQSASNRNFTMDYRRHVVGRIQAYFAARGDYRGAALPTDPAELERIVSQVLPDFMLEISGTKAPPYTLTRVSDGTPIGNIDELSSGEAQVIILALDILTMAGIWEVQDAPKRVILIDEPDAHVHPDLLVRFADFLVNVSERFKLQIVVASHSTTLLAALGQFGREQASVLYLDRTKSNFQAEPFTEILRDLAACLGGHALMGPMFGVPLLLVEGDDDYRIWSQVPRHHQVSFATLPCGGDEIKRYQKSLEKVFAALQEPNAPLSGYALIDADKAKPNADANTPQNRIRYIQLSCHESENLYLTDEVLALLGTDWPKAQQKIVAQSGQFGAKSAQLAGAAEWDRKTADIKAVIEQLTQILDEKRVHWTLRVARVIGAGRPIGQMADFLGEEVVSALWHTPPPQTVEGAAH